MPFRSKSQERLFQAAAHNRDFADKVGMSQKTAKKFISDSEGQDSSKLPERVKKSTGGTASRPFKW